MMEYTFKPSEQEAGSTVFGELIEKKSVTVQKGTDKERDSMLYKIKTSVDVPGMLGPKEMVVVIWGSKVLDQLLDAIELGTNISVIYKGKSTFTKGDFTWTQHDWELRVEG